MHLMQYERGMYGYATLTTALTELSWLRDEMAVHGSPFAARRRFAQIYIAVQAAQARAATTVRALADGRTVGPNSSVDKLLFAKAERDINDLIMDVRRDWMIAGVAPARTSSTGVGGDGSRELDATRAKWWYTRAATIMGGSAEVQRGIIADHLLGLPKEKR
jgi:acyl-CoA dehydrogenase